MKMMKRSLVQFLLIWLLELAATSGQNTNPNAIRVNKCCEKYEIWMDGKCRNAKEYNASEYQNTRKNMNFNKLKILL